MKTPGIYYGVIAAFCVLTLCIGMVNAADLAHSATNCTGKSGFWHGHPPSPNGMIPPHEQQGVDVTEVKRALRNGDTASVQAWLDKTRVAHKAEMSKSAGRFGPDNVTGRLEKPGIDVTTVRDALRNGDLSAVKEWLDSYREAHKDQMPNSTSRPGLEKIIERLEQQGVDVTEVNTLLRKGDADAVKAWLDAYREAHKDQTKNTRMTGKLHAQAAP